MGPRRATTVCPTCGRTTPAGAGHCRHCGADLAAPETWRDRTGETPPPDRRRRWGIALVTTGVLLACAGIGVVGYRVGLDAGREPAPSSAPTALPLPPTSTTPPSTAPPPTEPTRSGIVEVAPALAALPETASVTGVLTAYFTAINERDYPAYRATLVRRPGVAQTEADFRRRYRSTRDSDVRLLGLRSGEAGSWVASVAFTSRQDPVDSPDGRSTCLRWSIAFPLVPSGDDLLIDAAGLSTTVRRPC